MQQASNPIPDRYIPAPPALTVAEDEHPPPASEFASFFFFITLLLLLSLPFLLFPRFVSLPATSIRYPELLLLAADYLALSDAISCLHLQSPASSYLHPLAERYQHFLLLQGWVDSGTRRCFRPYCHLGSCGTWDEDVWNKTRSRPFSDFGAFVPLFVPWIHAIGRPIDCAAVVLGVVSRLQPRYLYVTLSYFDAGIVVRGRTGNWLPANLFVLSTGGVGHVPLLYSVPTIKSRLLNIPSSYRYDLVFMGSINSHACRMVAVKYFSQKLGARFFSGNAPNWIQIYEQSKFVLAPRGFGRNSFRLTELLRLAMVPVVVYDDIPWVAYYGAINWSQLGLIVRADELPSVLSVIRNTTAERITEMRLRIHAMYDTHFSKRAAYEQIFMLLRFGFRGSDLRCAIPPRPCGKLSI
jgi:hypothetical protein